MIEVQYHLHQAGEFVNSMLNMTENVQVILTTKVLCVYRITSRLLFDSWYF